MDNISKQIDKLDSILGYLKQKSAVLSNVSLDGEYYLIFAKKRLRWMLPKDPSIGLLVLNEWRPFSYKARFMWSIIKIAYRVRCIFFCHRMSYLNNKTVQYRFQPVIYFSSSDVEKKLVWFIIDKIDKKIAWIMKTPANDLAATKVLGEASMLERLSKSHFSSAPKLFEYSPTGQYLMQEHVGKKYYATEFGSLHLDFIRDLTHLSNHKISLRSAAEKIVSDLNAFSEKRAELKEVCQWVRQYLWLPEKFETTYSHGDFAPWNLRISDDNKLLAVDWEDASDCNLPMQDIFHFFYIQDYLFNHQENVIDKVLKNSYVQMYLVESGFSVETIFRLALFYLLSDAVSRIKVDDFRHFEYDAFQIRIIEKKINR